MGHFTFIPDFQTLATIPGQYPRESLLAQQGMYGADLDFARAHGSQALLDVLGAIPEAYHAEAAERGMELNVDVRVHNLTPGDYPASPGWHCDAPQRETQFSDAQELTAVNRSLVANLSSHPLGVSNTVFATESLTLAHDAMDADTWALMDATLGTDLTGHHHSADGQLVQFSCFSPHCIQPAQRAGVRMFVRISQWVRPPGFTPGLSRWEQVYRTVTRG